MSDPKIEIPLKVLIHKQEKRIVFAEANSDFVDVLFSFLTLPMGTIVRLLSNHSNPSQSHPTTIGSFTNLYGSIANLEDTYFASTACKDMLLNTRNSAEAQCEKLKVNLYGVNPIEYFTCEDHYCNGYFSNYSSVRCKKCHNFLSRKAYFSNTNSGEEGVFVLPTASFIVTDDLHVFPNMPGLTLALLENSGVTDFAVLEEKTFQIGCTEMLDLLKYSIMLKTPLTSMLLRKNYSIKIDKSVRKINSCMSTDQGIVSFKNMTVKVLVQKSTNTILLAYSSQDFIDFLFNFITIPLGRVISLISPDYPQAFCLGNILQSVSDLDVGEYIKSQEIQDMLLCPQLHVLYQWSNQYLPLREERIQKIYWTSKVTTPLGRFAYRLTMDSSVDCEIKLASPLGEAGFLNVPTKYMVTDDLVVTPLSSISCIEYIRSCKIPPSDIEEQVVNIGMEEALNLLRASLSSTSVLTNGLKHLIQTKPDTKTLMKKPKEEKLRRVVPKG